MAASGGGGGKRPQRLTGAAAAAGGGGGDKRPKSEMSAAGGRAQVKDDDDDGKKILGPVVQLPTIPFDRTEPVAARMDFMDALVDLVIEQTSARFMIENLQLGDVPIADDMTDGKCIWCPRNAYSTSQQLTTGDPDEPCPRLSASISLCKDCRRAFNAKLERRRLFELTPTRRSELAWFKLAALYRSSDPTVSAGEQQRLLNAAHADNIAIGAIDQVRQRYAHALYRTGVPKWRVERAIPPDHFTVTREATGTLRVDPQTVSPRLAQYAMDTLTPATPLCLACKHECVRRTVPLHYISPFMASDPSDRKTLQVHNSTLSISAGGRTADNIATFDHNRCNRNRRPPGVTDETRTLYSCVEVDTQFIGLGGRRFCTTCAENVHESLADIILANKSPQRLRQWQRLTILLASMRVTRRPDGEPSRFGGSILPLVASIMSLL